MSVGVVRAFKVDVSESAGDMNAEELAKDGGGPAGKGGPLEENPLAVNDGRTPGPIELGPGTGIELAENPENPPRCAFGVKIAGSLIVKTAAGNDGCPNFPPKLGGGGGTPGPGCGGPGNPFPKLGSNGTGKPPEETGKPPVLASGGGPATELIPTEG